MTQFEYDLGVIGGGAAGLTAAAGGAQFGAKTILIEKGDKLGGDCLHVGCVPSKALIRTANLWDQIRRTKEFGLPEIELPPVDLDKVMDRVRSVIEEIQPQDSPERFCGFGAAVRFGNPVFVDEQTVKLDKDRITAKTWIIATGSSPALPPVQGLSDVPYWTNETVFSQRKLPARLLVLGGGSIGLEMAQAFCRLGSKVTVIEFMDQILGSEDADIAEMVQERLEVEGVVFYTGTRTIKAESKGKAIRITIAPVTGPETTEVLEGDALIVATGRKPNIDGLGLGAAGVKYTENGISTDLRLRTNVPHIFACGDVNGRFPFTHVAGYEAGIALTNAVLRLPRKADYEKIGWCIYTDPEVASIGLNEKGAQERGYKYRIFEESFEDNDRALTEGEPFGKVKILVSPRGRFMGCQIIGAHAGELIHEWILTMTGGVKLSTVAGAVHVYPTVSEISKRVAGNVFSEKLFSDRTTSMLRLLFNLKGRASVLPDEE